MRRGTNYVVIDPTEDQDRHAFFNQCWSSAVRLQTARGSKDYYRTGDRYTMVTPKGLELLAPHYEWSQLLTIPAAGSVVIKDEKTHRSLTFTAFRFIDHGISGWCIMRGDYLEDEKEDDQAMHFRVAYEELNPEDGETRSEFLLRCWNHAERRPDAASVTGFYRTTDHPVYITRMGYELLMGGSDNYTKLDTTIAVASDCGIDRQIWMEYNAVDEKWHIERAKYCASK